MTAPSPLDLGADGPAARARPSLPDVVPAFAEYLARNPAWGALHIVLDDHNVRDCFVDWCIGKAAEQGDAEGEQLARLLRTLTLTQRGKLPREVARFLKSGARP